MRSYLPEERGYLRAVAQYRQEVLFGEGEVLMEPRVAAAPPVGCQRVVHYRMRHKVPADVAARALAALRRDNALVFLLSATNRTCGCWVRAFVEPGKTKYKTGN